MPKKILKAFFPEKCIGCELCVLAAMRELGKAGLEGSPIKILGGKGAYSIHLDPAVNDLSIKKIHDICPKGCFTIEDASEGNIDFAEEGRKESRD